LPPYSLLGSSRIRYSSSIQGSLSYQIVWLYLQKAGDHILVHLHDHSKIVKVTIIGCSENCYKFSSRKEFIAVFLDLMSSTYEVDVVFLIEVLNYYFAKSVGDSSVILTPVDDVLLWICGV
jgi:hypothetical protein